MKVFVTGGTGLLGSHLLFQLSCCDIEIKALKRKESNIDIVKKVFSYYSNKPEKHFSKISWIEGDLLDKEFVIAATEKADVIYHLAAIVSYSNRKEIKRKILYTNIVSTQNIIEACFSNNIKKLCYISSTSTLGSRNKSLRITEACELEVSKYTSTYALSKFEAEKLVLNASLKGLNAIILNPSIILGPGDWSKGSSKMFLNIYNGLGFFPRGTMGFVDVRDVVKAAVLLVEKNLSGEKFIISAENVSYQELFKAIAKNLGISKKLNSAPSYLLAIKWRVESIKDRLFNMEPLITKETVAFSKNEIHFSNQKIIDLLQFSFTPIFDTIEFCTSKFKLDHRK